MRWNREKYFNAIGIVLLASCFAYSLIRVASLARQEKDETITTIRFAHWQMEGGVRAALDAVAARYMELHPNVRIEQILIPERTFQIWLTTRLIGGNAPDLVSLGLGMTEDRLARFFTPLTSEVEKPNPYNKGTEHEGVPWRDTFIDGLATSPGLLGLFDYYAVPNSAYTVRLFYNAPLYEQVTGKTKPPASYKELREVFAAVKEYNRQTGESLVAIAGSKYNSPYLMDALFDYQTQKLMLKVDSDHRLRNPTPPFVSFFDGTLKIDDPAIVSALKLSREIGKNMPLGFLQLAREDATFYFVQNKALMISTGTWDGTSLRQEAPFQVGVIPIPLPLRDDPDYGSHVMGQASEAEVGGSLCFGLTRDSRHPEVALDFIKFMTSKEGSTLFSKVSNWLPSVVGVPVPDSIKAYAPIEEGYPSGFGLKRIGGAEVDRIYFNAFYALVAPHGGVEAFYSEFTPLFSKAIKEDAHLSLKNTLRTISRHDTTLAAYRYLGVTDDSSREKASRLAEVQNSQELDYYLRRFVVQEYERKEGGE